MEALVSSEVKAAVFLSTEFVRPPITSINAGIAIEASSPQGPPKNPKSLPPSNLAPNPIAPFLAICWPAVLVTVEPTAAPTPAPARVLIEVNLPLASLATTVPFRVLPMVPPIGNAKNLPGAICIAVILIIIAEIFLM